MLGLVKFQLKQEEDLLKNGFYPKVISLFGSGPASSMFESSDSFRSCVKCVLEHEFQKQKLKCLGTWLELMQSDLPPQFSMQITLDKDLEFYPSYNDLQVRLLIHILIKTNF